MGNSLSKWGIVYQIGEEFGEFGKSLVKHRLGEFAFFTINFISLYLQRLGKMGNHFYKSIKL